MATIKEQALEKLKKELAENGSDYSKDYYDWLCEQEDDELFNMALEDTKTLDGADDYIFNQAREISTRNRARVRDDVVFKWLVEYFKKPVEPVNKLKGKVQACVNQVKKTATPKPKEPKGKMMEGEQLNLLDFL